MASIYIHIPFCERKCVYCDFYSVEDSNLIRNFLDALHREIDMATEIAEEENIQSIYFGGGTPSLLEPYDIEKILQHLSEKYNLIPDAEVTIEVNPGTVHAGKFSAYNSMGINRVSIGVQSFFDEDLQFLSRIHTAKQAEETIYSAMKSGFSNISIDFIYALPTQSSSRWKENLCRIKNFAINHVSAYSLIIEDGTPLAQLVASKIVSPVLTETEAVMYKMTMDYLQSEGFLHYEVSNYAKPGYFSVHNSNYWNHSNYLGLGPSAHSFWKNKRWWNVRNVQMYCAQLQNMTSPTEDSEQLTDEQLFNEALMLNLRTGRLDLDLLRRKFHKNLNQRGTELISGLVTRACLTFQDPEIRLTNDGFLICDEISERLLTCFDVG